MDHYVLYVKTRHNLEIGNMSNKYQLTIFYTDPKNPPISFTSVNTTNHSKISLARVTSVHPSGVSEYSDWTFNWPIKTMDLSTLTYFWIVLIGVILSKLSTRIINQKQKNKSNNPPSPTTTAPPSFGSQQGPIDSLSKSDYLWMGISAVIALLIFSSI
jgi:hypothetical protein